MEEKPKKSVKINPSTHATLLAVVGGYLIYIAYQLLTGTDEGAGAMSLPVMIFFIVFFAVAGLAVILYAVRLWKQAQKETETLSDKNVAKENGETADQAEKDVERKSDDAKLDS